MLSRLNGWPIRSPADASRPASRLEHARQRVDADRYSFIVVDLHHLLLAGLPAHLTPFLAYWPPEHFGGSGVLATVTAGLYISWNGLRLISAATRLQGIFFWDFFIYLIEGLVFLITGLQARTLIDRIGHYSIAELAFSAAIVCMVVVVARFVWVYPAIYIPRWLSGRLRRVDPAPAWQWPFALAFTGVRGIVSLAAALAIPFATPDGAPFPARDLILFLTFSVILVTLVGQGLLLPWVIRMLGLAEAGDKERRADRLAEVQARRAAIEAVIVRLEQLARERGMTDSITQPLRARHRERLKHIHYSGDEEQELIQLSDCDDEIELLLIAAEREHINKLSRSGRIDDEVRRRIERELDLREANIANHRGTTECQSPSGPRACPCGPVPNFLLLRGTLTHRGRQSQLW
jgi:monovalent cation/hydrogen antiporter